MTRKTDARAVTNPQINSVTFYVNVGSNNFLNFHDIELDRTARIAPDDPNNPVEKIYKM